MPLGDFGRLSRGARKLKKKDNHNNMEEATYLIVNRQLKDLVRLQENMLAKANAMVSEIE